MCVILRPTEVLWGNHFYSTQWLFSFESQFATIASTS